MSSATGLRSLPTFRLDEFEVTVGRYERFLAASPNFVPTPGSGKNPYALGADAGWDESWNAKLLPPFQALSPASSCLDSNAKSQLSDERLPMSCVTWYLAQAFCIWDGGRLPTDLERLRAVAADDERPYPWGEAEPDPKLAVLAGSSPAVVGSKSPQGDGKWGHADLLGNLSEFVLDAYYPPGNSGEPYRLHRGSDFQQSTSNRPPDVAPADWRARSTGFRCAKSEL